MQKISPFLWFDDQAEAAMKFYTSIFPKDKYGISLQIIPKKTDIKGLQDAARG